MRRPDFKPALFRLRMMLVYPAGLLLMAYYRWVAPWFGTAHVAWLRVNAPRGIGRAILRLNGVRLNVQGLDHLFAAAPGPRVLMTNHNSRFDGYVLLAACPFAFKSFWSNTAHVTTEGYRLVALFGQVFDLAFLHDKHNMRNTIAEFRRAEQFVAAGGTLSFFPEGRFSRDGQVRDIGESCVALAIRAGATIVPIVLLDTRAAFEERRARGGPRPSVRMLVQPPIATAGMSPRDSGALVARVEQLMNDTIAAHRAATG